jgi:AcrR family transcriptional regulator
MADVRGSARQQLRDTIVDAARALTVAGGWDGVRMGEVAARAGVSRQTVYNEFATKGGLAEALARREVDRFVGGVAAALRSHGSDLHAGAHAAIAYALSEAAADPLVRAVLTSARGGSGALLPFLTTRADLVLTAATGVLLDWVTGQVPGVDRGRLEFAAQTVVRLVVSHIVLPTAPPEPTAAALADLTVRLFADAVAAPAPAAEPALP